MSKRPRRKTRGGLRLTVRGVKFRRALREAVELCAVDTLLYGSSYVRMFHGVPYRVQPMNVFIYQGRAFTK